MKPLLLVLAACGVLVSPGSSQQIPHGIPGGYELPNGWRLTPLGRAVQTEDMVLNISVAPDRKSVIALHSGFNPHGIVVVDSHSGEAVQRIPLKSAWMGLAWHPKGKRLYVSGGNANGRKPTRAPIYIFDYANGRLSNEPSGTLEETIDTYTVATTAATPLNTPVALIPNSNFRVANNDGSQPDGTNARRLQVSLRLKF